MEPVTSSGPAQWLDTAAMCLRFAAQAPPFLQHSTSTDEARDLVRTRLNQREQHFLQLVQRAVYQAPSSPYYALLHMAGCDYSDLERLVNGEGLEGALQRLARAGVWLSFEEFKGQKPVVRGSWQRSFRAEEFDNTLTGRHLEASSGGARGQGTRTAYDLAHIAAARSVYKQLTFEANEDTSLPVIMWSPVAPGYGPLEFLAHVRAGKLPFAWYSPVTAQDGRASARDRLINAMVPLLAGKHRVLHALPRYVPPDAVRRITRTILTLQTRHGGCIVLTDPSSAVRICHDASALNAHMNGVLFMLGGEPVTPARLALITQTGAHCSPLFVFIEGGYVGIGCLRPEVCDEVHLLSDSIALVQHERYVEHALHSVDAFLFTSLLHTTPKLLINVESGDWGRVWRRDCGCYFGRLGFSTHIAEIRSFDKLTSAGMNVTASYLIDLVERLLPERFGGTLLDYQIVEEEDALGEVRISIVISPDVGAIDEAAVVSTVVDGMLRDGKRGAFPAHVWRAANTFRVSRAHPHITSRGKLLPLHVRRQHADRSPGSGCRGT